MSWTTNLDCAHGFAEWHDFNGFGLVYEVTVPTKHVLAICDSRGESEVIINPFGIISPYSARKEPRQVRCLGRPDPARVKGWRDGVKTRSEAALMSTDLST